MIYKLEIWNYKALKKIRLMLNKLSKVSFFYLVKNCDREFSNDKFREIFHERDQNSSLPFESSQSIK